MALPISSRPFYWGAHVLGLTAITLVLIWTIRFRGGFGWEDKDLLFNVHPFLMLLGFVVLNGEAIMSLRSFPWIDNEDTKTKIHLFSHAMAFLLGIYGLTAVLLSQNESNIANFHSLHSWIGIGIFVLKGILMVWQSIYTSTILLHPEVVRPSDYQGLMQGLLRSTGPDYTNEHGRIYGNLRFLIPAGYRVSEDMEEPVRVRGLMRFFNPRGGFSVMNNQKEQITGDVRFYTPTGDIRRKNEQARLCAISRFFHYGDRLEPVNKELMIDSIESFGGTLELTGGWLPWHTLFGMVLYIVVVGNAVLGFLQKLTILENSAAAAGVVPKYGSEAHLVNFTAIITVLFGAFVIFTLLGDPVILRVETNPDLPPRDPESRANNPPETSGANNPPETSGANTPRERSGANSPSAISSDSIFSIPGF